MKIASLTFLQGHALFSIHNFVILFIYRLCLRYNKNPLRINLSKKYRISGLGRDLIFQLSQVNH